MLPSGVVISKWVSQNKSEITSCPRIDMCYPTLDDLPPALSEKSWSMWTEESNQLPKQMANGQSWPRITVVTPSYNQGRFIEDTIRSVILQCYPNLEYLVIDGGSDDQTRDILHQYDSWISSWVSEPDSGQSHALNKGLSQATGTILGWLNSDDLLMPGALRKIAELYVEDSSATAWVGGCYRINQDRKILSTVLPHRLRHNEIANWWHQGVFYQPSCYFSAEAWNQVGPLDESLQYSMDLDLWLKLSKIGYFVPTVQVLSAALIHPGAKTSGERDKMHAETISVQVRHGYLDLAGSRLGRVVRRQEFRPLLKRTIKEWVRWLCFWKRREKFDDFISLADRIAKRNEE